MLVGQWFQNKGILLLTGVKVKRDQFTFSGLVGSPQLQRESRDDQRSGPPKITPTRATFAETRPEGITLRNVLYGLGAEDEIYSAKVQKEYY